MLTSESREIQFAPSTGSAGAGKVRNGGLEGPQAKAGRQGPPVRSRRRSLSRGRGEQASNWRRLNPNDTGQVQAGHNGDRREIAVGLKRRTSCIHRMYNRQFGEVHHARTLSPLPSPAKPVKHARRGMRVRSVRGRISTVSRRPRDRAGPTLSAGRAWRPWPHGL
jgi:hypothetical protein